MKRAIIAIIFLAIIVTVGIVEQVYVRKTFDGLIEELTLLQDNLDDREKAEENVESIISWWEEQRKLMELFVMHDDIREIMVMLGEIEGYVKSDMLDDARATNIKLLEASRHISHLLQYRIAYFLNKRIF